MDYVEMIKDPELVLGFQELVADADTVVVKRAVKVFTCVYHHTLRLLSLGELDGEVLLKSWTPVNGVVDRLLAMVRQCNNEGILIHLLRFLEAAVTAHLSYDVSKFPRVFERGREVIKTGLKALKDLVTTPYVGGSSFNFGIRALISIACLRPDLWEPVTDLLKKQMASLPPTLFDHNVRSLNKTLQRNLFRLLRRADKFELKEKLIEMMVRVGVPRKAIAPWAPQALEMRKRSPPAPPSDLSVIGRQTPPEKKPRLELVRSKERASRSRSNTPEIPTDPRLQVTRIENPPEVLEPPPEKKADNADLLFLTSLLPKVKDPEPMVIEQKAESFSSENVEFDKDMHSLLNLENVCNLVIQNMNDVPDTEPENFISSYKSCGMPSEDTETMRIRLSSLLGKYIDPSYINELKFESQTVGSEFSSASSASSEPKNIEEKVNSDSSSPSSTPPITPPTTPPPTTPPLADTDMRRVYQDPSTAICDVDMRISDPRLTNKDPRLSKDPRTRRDVDCRTTFPQPMDPRLDRNVVEQMLPRLDPRTVENPRVDPRVENRSLENPRVDPRVIIRPRIDPRLSSKTKKNIEPRKSRWDPRPEERNPSSFNREGRFDSKPPEAVNHAALNREGGWNPRHSEERNSSPPKESKWDPRPEDINSASRNRESRWDPRPALEINSSPFNRENECPPQRNNDPVVNRNPSHGQGLLPHPDPRIFQRENMDPRFPFQKPMNAGDLQSQPNFMLPQTPFAFNSGNTLGQFNPFLGNLAMPSPNTIPPMFNNLPFGWDNNLRNPPPTVLLAQTLASVQQGLLSPTIMNH